MKSTMGTNDSWTLSDIVSSEMAQGSKGGATSSDATAQASSQEKRCSQGHRGMTNLKKSVTSFGHHLNDVWLLGIQSSCTWTIDDNRLYFKSYSIIQLGLKPRETGSGMPIGYHWLSSNPSQAHCVTKILGVHHSLRRNRPKPMMLRRTPRLKWRQTGGAGCARRMKLELVSSCIYVLYLCRYHVDTM